MLQLAGSAAVAAMTPRQGRRVEAASTALPVILLFAQRPQGPVSPLLTGANNDQWFGNSQGLWDPSANAPVPQVVAEARQAGLGLVRYPGGTPASLFNWKAAIGPQSQRGLQVDGRANGGPLDSVYGPDEHMRFCAAVGAQAQIHMPFVVNTPQDAADWVAYMNASTTNPWGARRAANGHPAPYGVRHWEIGNELDRPTERYWLSADNTTAMEQYAFGGSQPQTGQRVGTPSDQRPSAAISTGAPNQTFTVWYPPVVPESQTVFVAGSAWTPVAELATAGPSDRVYQFDPPSGAITFGDGLHGAIPPQGAQITVDYTSGPHAGFVDFYDAMKAVDPSIQVVASWSPIMAGTGLGGVSFPQLMAERGYADRYDGMVIHPYTNFAANFQIQDFPSPRVGHDDTMLGEAHATSLVDTLIAEVRQYAPPGVPVTISEFGALFFGHGSAVYPRYFTTMTHVCYMASQWARYANRGLPWVEGNTLITPGQGLRGVLGAQPTFVFTAEAVARQLLAPLVAGGGQIIDNRVENNPAVQTAPTPQGSSYDALVTTAARSQDGALRVVVVNRSADDAVDALVTVDGFDPGATVTANVASGLSFDDYNDVGRSDVQIQTGQATIGSTAFRWTFPAHSVTLLTLPARS